MLTALKEYAPVYGKTYSLFGESTSTKPFYDTIFTLTNELLAWYPGNEEDLLKYIQSSGRNRRNLSRVAGKPAIASELAYILNRAHEDLSVYLRDVEQHIRSVPFHKHLNDRSILTTREQYYLYMIEFELINRINLSEFISTGFRIALLPYCLKENHIDCKATPDEIDYRCKTCLKTCYINRLGKILQENGINPYILSRGRVGKLLMKLNKEHGSVGVLGIACIVELIEGMRLCRKAKLPVIGIPLNANRCPRWLGTMHETNIDLEALQSLVADAGQFRIPQVS